MKLSLFDELNDPFELQPYSLADARTRVQSNRDRAD